ncbi:hypothetical protein EYF80_059807 [Liparis tanakae]|uniref:Uncharacterized protein n=1 Tax=Liparis tanakae TaxID=230148 RepID=A0A4Z2ENS9_9TELE|nr:hypothetical protein EYF80_059807 [Liparis tanakae]
MAVSRVMLSPSSASRQQHGQAARSQRRHAVSFSPSSPWSSACSSSSSSSSSPNSRVTEGKRPTADLSLMERVSTGILGERGVTLPEPPRCHRETDVSGGSSRENAATANDLRARTRGRCLRLVEGARYCTRRKGIGLRDGPQKRAALAMSSLLLLLPAEFKGVISLGCQGERGVAASRSGLWV